jgi:hypothetical protein
VIAAAFFESVDTAAQARQTQEMVAALEARIARMRAIEVGQRVLTPFGLVGLHGVVHELVPGEGEDPAQAWVHIVGHPRWLHKEQVKRLRAVCGLCRDCIALNDRPRCITALEVMR